MSTQEPLSKDFAVFDCDAHINDPYAIWEQYVEPEHREIVRQTYWKGRDQAILNGRTVVRGGDEPSPSYNTICIAGPGMNPRLMRKLQQMALSEEQKDYLKHMGAYDPLERLKDMDLMGIDQVMIVPTHLISNLPFAESVEGSYALARAYNNWLDDFTKAAPERLFGAAVLPVGNPLNCVEELHRVAEKDFRVALIRPIDARGRYPTQVLPTTSSAMGATNMDAMYKAFEDTGIVLGMHTFPAMKPEPAPTMASPGELLSQTANGTGRYVDMQTLSFVFEAITWLAPVLLSGFLDRYPNLHMAIFESNATWLPQVLAHCDRLFRLYRNERRQPAKRLPSEAFHEQCFIAFESDETAVFRQWKRYEEIGVWSSDAYHHDGADVWSAMREMKKANVPLEAQAKLLGGNARRMYGITGKVFTRHEPKSIARPDWFPREDADFERWWQMEADPRARHRSGDDRSVAGAEY